MTEAELVAVDDLMPQILWTRMFLEGQGLKVKDNIINQDNQSAIKLENNGRAFSGKQTRHINIRYFFVTDRIQKGDAQIVHCPTDMLIADFYTKPLQGKQFRIFRNLILNLDEPVALNHSKAESIENKESTNLGSNKIKKSGTKVKLQECVGLRTIRTYKYVLCGGIHKRMKLRNTGLLKPILKKRRILDHIGYKKDISTMETIGQTTHNFYLV